MECTECNTYINTYIPQPHQAPLHADPHRNILNAGGYGTGKTTTDRQEVYKHLLITPNANVLIGANVSSQYEQTIKREIENDIPKQFIRDYSIQKAYFDLTNGARLLYRPFDDPDKLKSLNLSMAVIIEGSEVNSETYTTLKTRLRNRSATSINQHTGALIADWRKIIVETNPDPGWVRNQMLQYAERINQYGSVSEKIVQNPDEIDRNISAHVASTDCNKYLPPDYIEENTKNKPAWWVARFIYSSFSYAEGLVYPTATANIVESFDPPPEWKRVIAFDYGLHDVAAYVFAAIDEKNGVVYIYKEARTTDQNIDGLSALYYDNIKDIPSGGLLTGPIIDPKSGGKRDYNKKTLMDLFLAKGIAFQPGHVSVIARILRLNTYFEAGKLKIMDRCTGLIKELRDYKYKPRTIENDTGSDKPIDKNNHSINGVEWIAMKLPDDPRNILYGIYDITGKSVTNVTAQERKLPHALQDMDSNPFDQTESFGIRRNLWN